MGGQVRYVICLLLAGCAPLEYEHPSCASVTLRPGVTCEIRVFELPGWPRGM